jgi:hypothetical protein
MNSVIRKKFLARKKKKKNKKCSGKNRIRPMNKEKCLKKLF